MIGFQIVWDGYRVLIGLKEIGAVGFLVGVTGKGEMQYQSNINLSRYYIQLLCLKCS